MILYAMMQENVCLLVVSTVTAYGQEEEALEKEAGFAGN